MQIASLLTPYIAFIFIFIPSVLIANSPKQAEFVLNYRAESTINDGLYQYYKEILDAALKTTEPEYGNYKINVIFDMTFTRAKLLAKNNSLPNLLIGTGYSKEFSDNYSFIPLPMDFGITSYRICFTSKSKIQELKTVQTIDDLKRYSIGQGKDWLDVKVLKENGFNVIEYPNYKSLFLAVSRGRFDLFCRGLDEILPEWEAHNNIKDLAIEESFIIYYPFPRYFWTNKNNTLLIERLTRGLKGLYDNGTALTLWKKHHEKSIKFVHLKNRKIFYLNNHDIDPILKQHQQYFYNPLD